MKRIKYFIYSAGGILLAAALIRFLIAGDPAQVLGLGDPLLHVPLRWAVVAVGVVELGVALVCLWGKRLGLQVGLLTGMACLFVVYLGGLMLAQCHPQGSCLGSLTDPLRLHHGIGGLVMNLVPAYFLVGSILAGIGFLRAKRPAAVPPMQPAGVAAQTTLERSLKISCPECGGHIEFPTKFFGEKLPCPHCKALIMLQKARAMKMSCPGCGGHVEFSSDAAGQRTRCPHCKEEIELKAN